MFVLNLGDALAYRKWVGRRLLQKLSWDRLSEAENLQYVFSLGYRK